MQNDFSHITPEQWESTTFEGNRREQLREWAKMSFADKMQWVEDAQELAAAFDRARPSARLIVPISQTPEQS